MSFARLRFQSLSPLCASRSLAIRSSESLVLLRETSMGTSSHILLLVRVVELLFLMSENSLVLAHMHRLLNMLHLAVLLVP